MKEIFKLKLDYKYLNFKYVTLHYPKLIPLSRNILISSFPNEDNCGYFIEEELNTWFNKNVKGLVTVHYAQNFAASDTSIIIVNFTLGLIFENDTESVLFKLFWM